MIRRGGNKVIYIPGDAIRVTQPAAAAIPWWLSGGISAANCVAAYQPKGAASLAASYTNLANPGTYNAAPGTAPSFASATGWQFTNASSQYLTTGIIPGATWTFAIRYSDAIFGNYAAFGVLDSTNNKRVIFLPNNVTGYTTSFYGTRGANMTPPSDNGVCSFYRSSIDTKIYFYFNGGLILSTLASTWNTPSIPLIIGARNLGGSVDSFASTKIQAWAAYNLNLTDPQTLAVSTAMAAL